MSRKKPIGAHHEKGGRRGGLHAAGPERDLACWLPHLVRHALRRPAGRVPTLDAGEIRDAARAVRALSRGFTGKRSLAGASYFEDEAALAAYLLFFWPVSYMQARLMLDRLLPPGAFSGSDVIDLGAGPGPLAAAALDAGARRVTALDANETVVRLAGDLARSLGHNISTGRWDLAREGAPPGRYRFILLGHILNELWPGVAQAVEKRAERVEALAERLAPGGRVVILEPALLSTTRELLRLRTLLADRGLPVCAPCLRQGPCPCLEDETSTCHADWPWRPPSFLVRLAHAARLGKERLRFSTLVVGRRGEERPTEDPDVYRVVSERMLSKSGRLRFFICNVRGRFTLSAKPAGGEPWLKRFLSLRRYDTVRIGGVEVRENGFGLLPGSTLERVDVRGGSCS